MKQYQQYSQKVRKIIDEVKSSNEPVLIFGAGRAGWYILKVLEHFNIKVAGFIDNNNNGKYEGYDVLTPGSYKNHPKSHIFLGVFKPNSSDKVAQQLRSFGFVGIKQGMDAFLFYYYEQVVKRNCDMAILADSIAILFENYEEKPDHYGYTAHGNFVAPFTTVNITQKCSLDCIDCGQLIPYYKSPVNFSAETIFSDVKQYAKAFDLVPEVSLHGGEPLMNKQMGEICEAVATIPNIVFVSFVTNGTIVPSLKTITSLSRSGAALQQSDYKELSPKQNEVFELCREYKVYSDIDYTTESRMWDRYAPTKKYNRSDEENNKVYVDCVNSKICCQIMDGELHRCAHSMHSARLGRIPKMDGDAVQLNRDESEDEKLVSEIRGFFTRKNALGACEHCDPNGSIDVIPALQLEKKQIIKIRSI
ncbi:MAG: radical SAM protein [Flavobacteriales bacterium]|nr:radical SAM protein [Flavobacteriales bacterium]